ncbi:MAG: hypothetical protein JNN30_19110 [Rhodanobacteraceae bacterium]|nr:hypothetical protein [Rhodanobacteraceae bacterium]
MPRYELNLQIDSQSVAMLRAAGQRITIGRSVNGGSPNLAWLAFNPFISNTISWEEAYGLYASTVNLVNGASIYPLSAVEPPAREASIYPFLPSMYFGNPMQGGVPAGSYGIQNTAPPSSFQMLTFGLTQAAVVNGAGTPFQATSAIQLLPQMSAVLTPSSTIYVWLQSMFGSGTFIGNLSGPTTRVTFGGSVTSQSLVYDPNRGVFVPVTAGASENASTDHVEVSEPSLY